MPVQTQLQQRRGTAASWTSTNPTLAAGEIGFESDTGKFKIGNGSTAWASLAYATNGAAVSPLTTKGDLFTYSTANARLAVGNNGEALVADSSATTGLSYQGNFAAGKNKIINGDFAINQRGFTSTSVQDYGFDRWIWASSGATGTYSAQAFTPGTAPVAGYESTNFARLAITVGNDNSRLQQPIEDVRTFAGQTVTASFWAKGTNPTTAGNLMVLLNQTFGTGGSASVRSAEQTFVLTANWTRYSFTFAIPSIAGKTIGTGSSFQIWLGQGVNTSTDAWTLDVWGVQVEAGSVATAFQTATGTIQGELAACQRYYQKSYPQGYAPGINVNTTFGSGVGIDFGLGATVPVTGVAGTTRGKALPKPFPVVMRTTPTIRFWDSLGNLSKYSAYDANTSYISGNNSLDAFGGYAPYDFGVSFQTVAASATHIYCVTLWEASAEI